MDLPKGLNVKCMFLIPCIAFILKTHVFKRKGCEEFKEEHEIQPLNIRSQKADPRTED